MSENTDELRNMLITFRVSELQMLLGFAGRNKSGRKNELQQRALELLRVRSHPIHQKIRDLYKTIQQSGALPGVPAPSSSPGNKDIPASPATGQVNNMPQTQGGVPRTTAAVHPYNVDTRQMAARQPQMYQQNLYSPYPQYSTAKQPQSVLANNYPVHPDVKFRRLPFYDILADLLKPSSLVPQSNQRMQEGTFYFHLTPQQATDVASSRDIRPGVKCDYVKQVQMRFCLLETTCEQEDYFPPNVIVKVNNKLCPLPNPIPTNKPGVEPKRPPRPVNITQMVKLSPTVANTITVSWAADYGRGYAITVALVHKLTSFDLLQRLKNKGAKNADHTRALIKEKLSDDGDSEIATTSLRVSLMCPLGKMRMTTPCRAITCSHLQCFDASLYLQMNERKPTWNCPVCDKQSLYDNLVIDGYFQEVLNSPHLPSECNEIQLNQDGSWSCQNQEKKTVKVEKPTTVIGIDDSIEIIGDDVEIIVNNTATSSTDKPKEEEKPVEKKKDVVDLTLSDSDDDDEPLAKRRAPNPKPDDSVKCSNQKNQTSNDVLPFKIRKTDTTVAQRMRLYRQRKREQAVKKCSKALTSSERSRLFRQRKKQSIENPSCPTTTDSLFENLEPNINPSISVNTIVMNSTSLSSSSNQSRVTTTPGPSSVSSSGYPASPSVINLDSPSPPRSPHPVPPPQQQPASCMMTAQTNGSTKQPTPFLSPSNSMPYLDLDLDNEAASATINYPTSY